jgi:hypothetical protein
LLWADALSFLRTCPERTPRRMRERRPTHQSKARCGAQPRVRERKRRGIYFEMKSEE